MSDVSKRFEQLVKNTYKKFLDQGIILPVKTEKGILVGDVLIESEGPLKNISRNGKILYKQISLNAVAVRMANLIASNQNHKLCNELYDLDVKYSKHFMDSKIFIDNYHRAVNSNNVIRADILWTRYEIAKEKAISTKERAEELARFE
jgi:fumarylacetoacetate (FAA) hydrolase family protein